jgi:hypothetical protein
MEGSIQLSIMMIMLLVRLLCVKGKWDWTNEYANLSFTLVGSIGHTRHYPSTAHSLCVDTGCEHYRSPTNINLRRA